MSESTVQVPRAGLDQSAAQAELMLEREKIQIERERLALERERLSTERSRWRADMALRQRAAGRMSVSMATMVLGLLVAAMGGGLIGAWIVELRQQHRSDAMTSNILQALGETNATAEAGMHLRTLGRQSGGGYVLIVD